MLNVFCKGVSLCVTWDCLTVRGQYLIILLMRWAFNLLLPEAADTIHMRS